MDVYVLDFERLDKASLPLVGGKGANLGEMTRAGFPVPPGFCVTTAAYRDFIAGSGEMERFFDRLDELEADQLEQIAELGRHIREHLTSVPIPAPIRSAITSAWSRAEAERAYAVRSSATAEDLPSASFAGQQDTYLNVRGEEALLQAVRRCWASLFTDRAISYRAKNGFDHRSVLLSVVVQQMVFPDVSGIMFTADPVSGHRGTISIDASFGLGEALVSGLVSADLYRVRGGSIVSKQVAKKKLAIFALPEGGTETRELAEAVQERQALDDAVIMELAALGERVKRHYGTDQDIEWCVADGRLFLVQSRPITSLYPLPEIAAAAGEPPRLLMSFGHQQMMTDAVKPMGLSVLRTIFPFGKNSLTAESCFTYTAGGRMFIDITKLLTLKPARRGLPKILGNVDEAMAAGVEEFVQREEVISRLPKEPGLGRSVIGFARPIVVRLLRNLLIASPSKGGAEMSARMKSFEQKGADRLSGLSGAARIERVQELAGETLRTLFQQMMAYPLSGVVASKLTAALIARWLPGSDRMAVLNKSLPGNVTSEMGLQIGDLADAARPYPQVAALIREGDGLRFREKLRTVEGGDVFGTLWDRFMERYGMRCPGEIDITRPRWYEDASTLLPSIDSHMRTLEPGEHRLKFEQGAREAEAAGLELLDKLRRQPFGWLKVRLMRRLLRGFRGLMGLREHPKYGLIRRFGRIRLILQEEGRKLAEAGVLGAADDVFYLTLEELKRLLQEGRTDGLASMLEARKREYDRFRSLTPPRLMTSEGELLTGRRRRQEAPEGALLGTPVSAGVVEGVARVVMRPEEAKLNKGEIMIAPFTDPGWTPLFHSAVGLVMEVGGLMTHGAVVAREYGLPAVVGIDGATQRIQDGDTIRLDGTRGYVLVLKRSGEERRS